MNTPVWQDLVFCKLFDEIAPVIDKSVCTGNPTDQDGLCSWSSILRRTYGTFTHCFIARFCTRWFHVSGNGMTAISPQLSYFLAYGQTKTCERANKS